MAGDDDSEAGTAPVDRGSRGSVVRWSRPRTPESLPGWAVEARRRGSLPAGAGPERSQHAGHDPARRPHADARHAAQPLPQLPTRSRRRVRRGTRCGRPAPARSSSGAKVAREALAQQVVGCGDRLRDGRRRWRRGGPGHAGPVRSPRTVRPGGPRCARSAMPAGGEGTVCGMPDHCRRSCSAATKWYRSSMSAKWWNTSRSDTPARAATALAVGSGSPAERRATRASATLRRVRRPRARRPSVASSPASAATSRSTRSSSCLRGSGSARSRPPKPRSPAPPAASEEPGVTGSHFPFQCGNPTPGEILRPLAGREPVLRTHDGATTSSWRSPRDELSVHRPRSRAFSGPPPPATERSAAGR